VQLLQFGIAVYIDHFGNAREWQSKTGSLLDIVNCGFLQIPMRLADASQAI